MVKVLIVDDSALMRKTLTDIIEEHPEFKVIGSANDPFIAAAKLRQEIPDVITLDIEMPKMDGLSFLKRIMAQRPIPTVVISSLTYKGAETAMQCLEHGAIDIITKPSMASDRSLADQKQEILEKIKAASIVKSGNMQRRPATAIPIRPDKKIIPYQRTGRKSMITTTERIVGIGASTGGTEALHELLEVLPGDFPGILIAQHMPEIFTLSFANRLNELCRITVKEAKDGDPVIRGQALIAPGNKHMELRRSGARYYVKIHQGDFVNRHRPSVDVLFNSMAEYAGRNSIGVILTGMGADGARGITAMHEAGAFTIAQDEKSCVVFGMPKEAIKLGGIDSVLALANIPSVIAREAHSHIEFH